MTSEMTGYIYNLAIITIFVVTTIALSKYYNYKEGR